MRAVITAGDTPTCTYTNTADATLSIHKTTVGGDGTFDFDDDGTGVPATSTSRPRVARAPTRATPSPSAQASSTTKIVTETVPAGWTLTDIVCTGDAGLSSVGS